MVEQKIYQIKGIMIQAKVYIGCGLKQRTGCTKYITNLDFDIFL